MNMIEHIITQLQDTDSVALQAAKLFKASPDDIVTKINMEIVAKRRKDLERRLNTELRLTQTDLVEYHVDRVGTEHYPVLAIAGAVSRFQELFTAVFDAIRTVPKQRYRPSTESVELSTLDFSMAHPIGSVVVSMSLGNERLIAMQSDLDKAFEKVFQLLRTQDSEGLREMATVVGISAVSKAHGWAQTASEYGLNTSVAVKKDNGLPLTLKLSGLEATRLKEVIEEKSDKTSTHETVVGELLGIDVDHSNSFFHIKTVDGRTIEGKLSSTFQSAREWAVHVVYSAQLTKIVTVKYSTGEEKIDWFLGNLQSQ